MLRMAMPPESSDDHNEPPKPIPTEIGKTLAAQIIAVAGSTTGLEAARRGPSVRSGSIAGPVT
jgi:hypothetical protein